MTEPKLTDLRAAAERRVQYADPDTRMLADSALRWTDPTPVDEAWLWSVGFADWGSSGHYLRADPTPDHNLYYVRDVGHLLIEMRSNNTRTVTTSKKPTRGHVLCVLMALNIQLPATAGD